MNPLNPTQDDLDQFAKIVQMNLDFAHFEFIDEHVEMFMLDPSRFDPRYMIEFLILAKPKREMLKTYDVVLAYVKSVVPASELTGLN